MAAVALVLAAALTVDWVARDRFLDGDEAQHALRSLATLEALGDWWSGRLPFTALVTPRIDEPKPWYGWPYYLANALLWKVSAVDADAAVLLNLGWLALLVISAAALARGVTEDEGSAGPTVVLVSLLPGVLSAAHSLGPTLCVAATVTLASALTVASSGFRRPVVSLLAGAATALGTLVKVSSVVYVLPVVVYALVVSTSKPRSRRSWRGLVLFAAGMAPAAAWFAHREILVFWSGMARGLFQPASVTDVLERMVGIWWANLGPAPSVLLAACALFLAVRGTGRERRAALVLLLWIVVPVAAIVVAAGNPGTSRDHVPLAVPAAILIVLAALRLEPRWRAALAAGIVLLASGAEVVRLWPAPAARSPLLSAGPRLTPAPDPLGDIAADLAALVPPGAPSRCGCLPFPPYPTPGDRRRPVVLVDSAGLGPENLRAWLALRGRDVPWQIGYVPYGLSCGAYRAALHCAAAILVAPQGAGATDAGYDMAGARRDARAALRGWGRTGGPIPAATGGPLAVRLPEAPGYCQSAGPDRERFAGEIVTTCGDDFFARHLEATAADWRGDRAAEGTARAARLAAIRLAELEAGKDVEAVRFGETYLARAIAAPIPP